MKPNNLFVAINSRDPERLRAFYRDVVGLEANPDLGPGAFRAGAASFAIGEHSAITGDAKEPERVLYNFFVDDAAAEQAQLESRGVKFKRPAEREEWGGIIATFTDPDGNYMQLIEYKP